MGIDFGLVEGLVPNVFHDGAVAERVEHAIVEMVEVEGFFGVQEAFHNVLFFPFVGAERVVRVLAVEHRGFLYASHDAFVFENTGRHPRVMHHCVAFFARAVGGIAVEKHCATCGNIAGGELVEGLNILRPDGGGAHERRMKRAKLFVGDAQIGEHCNGLLRM